jgi:hypothetical protein
LLCFQHPFRIPTMKALMKWIKLFGYELSSVFSGQPLSLQVYGSENEYFDG